MQSQTNNLIDFSLEELTALVIDMGEKRFRAEQLYLWLNKGVPFSRMSNLPDAFLARISEQYKEGYAEILSKQVSKDGTTKYLLGLTDGLSVEAVLMKQSYGNTLCISTQVGCRMGCAFCASGALGLQRNLTAGEILSQVLAAKTDENAVNNLVLMGMGEPFDNYDHVVKFIRLVNHPKGLNIGMRSISLSTCGLVPGIIAFADEGLPVTLAISLHAPNDDIRKQIMPIADRYMMGEVLDAAKYYFNKTGRRVIIEYVLLAGINDSTANAEELATRLKGFNCHVNLIPYNAVADDFKAPTPATVDAFLHILTKNRIGATVRKTSGDDIDGACGQLRLKHVKSK
ncbi:MAG: 23S rRNA (adenine(2503)-C(2))-methyltransferase RlmN [Eubacteriales bacterium]